jgi:hypothetical protein
VHEITYTFSFDDGERVDLSFCFEEETFDLVLFERASWPEWTRLDFNRCENCPLNAATSFSCPVAVALVDVIEASSRLVSHDELSVTVRMPGRTVSARLSAQDALRSLMGLIIPASGCPHTAVFKPMARFHLPFSDQEETLYRVTSMYRLAQHVRVGNRLEDRPGFQDLVDAYARINVVNLHLVERLRAATQKDSALNAVVLLDVFAQLLPMQLDEPLEVLYPLFEAYLR